MKTRLEEEEKKKKDAELAFKQRQEVLKQLVMNYRINKTKLDYNDPPHVGMEPLITNNLLKVTFDEINTFNFLNTPCVNYVKYIPPLDRLYGYVPADGVMSWEIKNFLSTNRNASIPTEELPTPVNNSYIYRPFFYIKKPDCHINSTIYKLLARTGNYNTESDSKTQEYVPVIVETSPSYSSPELVSPTFKMAIPGR